jgi:hypothetical protein
MKSLAFALAGTALFVLTTATSQALPLPAPTAGITGASSVEQVGWRCGWHRHWSYRLHRCVHN